MADVRANMVAVTVPPVTKSTALSDYLFCKQGHKAFRAPEKGDGTTSYYYEISPFKSR